MKVDHRSTFPAVALDTFAARWDGFADLPRPIQTRLVALLCSAARPGRFQHSHYPGAIFLPCRVRDALYGRRGFAAINEHLKLFEISTHYMAGKYTKAYRLTPAALQLIEDIPLMTTRLIDDEGRIVKKPAARAIRERDSDSNHRMGTGNIPPVVAVDIDAMIGLLNEARQWRWHYKDGLPAPDTRILEKRLTEYSTDAQKVEWLTQYGIVMISIAILHCDTDYLPRGQTEIQYWESASGRLYTRGQSLQTDIRELRKAAFSGHFDYDVANCHYSLFAQLANRIGLETPAIDHYLQNKSAIRRELSEATRAPGADIKRSLIALIYGARTSMHPQSAISQTLGKDKAGVLFRHLAFSTLAAELHLLRKPVLDGQPRHRGRIVNPFGKSAPKEVVTPEEQLAFVLQGAEAACLHSVINRHGSDLRLLQHDGWTSAVRLDVAQLEAEISADTGFRVTIEESEL